jgi:hypothetical protein
MTPREIIAEAWNITSTVPSLRRWAYASSLLETLLNVKLLFTQAYFGYVYLYGHGDAGFFDIEIWIWNSLPRALSISILLSFILLLVVEFFAPHLCLGPSSASPRNARKARSRKAVQCSGSTTSSPFSRSTNSSSWRQCRPRSPWCR